MALSGLGLGFTLTATDLASKVISAVKDEFLGLDKGVTKVATAIAAKLSPATFAMAESLRAAGAPLAEIKAAELAVARETEAVTTAFKGMAAGLAVASAGLIALKTAFDLADEAGAVTYQIAALASHAGLATSEVEGLSESMIRLSIGTGEGPLSAANALRVLGDNGLNAKASLDALKPTLDLVAGSFGKLNQTQAAALLADTLHVFPELAGDATSAADKLARAVTGSNLTLRELPTILKNLQAGSSAVGASLDDTLAALKAVSEAVPNATKAGRSLERAMKALATDKASDALFQLGADIRDSEGKTLPFLDVVGKLTERFGDLTASQRTAALATIVGQDGLTALNPLIDQLNKKAQAAGGGTAGLTKAIQAMRAAMNNAAITADGLANSEDETFLGLLDRVHAAVDRIKYLVGTSLETAFKPILARIGEAFDFVARAILMIPRPLRDMAARFALLASASAVVTGLGLALAAAGPLLAKLALLLIPVVLPFLKVIAVIGALALAAYALKAAWDANFGGIRSFVLPILERVQLALESLFGLLTEGRIEGDLAQRLFNDKPVLAFVDAVSRVWKIVESVLGGAFEALGAAAGDIFRAIGTEIAVVIDVVSELANTVWSVLRPALEILGLAKPGAEGLSFLRQISYLAVRIATGPLVLMFKAAAWVARGFGLIADALRYIAEPIAFVVDMIRIGFQTAEDFVFGVVDRIAAKIQGLIKAVPFLERLLPAAPSSPGGTAGGGGTSIGVGADAATGISPGLPSSLALPNPRVAAATNPADRPPTLAEIQAALDRDDRARALRSAGPAGNVYLDGNRVGQVQDARARDQGVRVGAQAPTGR